MLELKPGEHYVVENTSRGVSSRGDWQRIEVKDEKSKLFHTIWVTSNFIDDLKKGDTVCLKKFVSLKIGKKPGRNGSWMQIVDSTWEVELVSQGKSEFTTDGFDYSSSAYETEGDLPF